MLKITIYALPIQENTDNKACESGIFLIGRISFRKKWYLCNINSCNNVKKERVCRSVYYQPFGQEQIEPNRELRGRILMYGEGLEVVEPLTLREQIREVIKRQMAQYTEE